MTGRKKVWSEEMGVISGADTKMVWCAFTRSCDSFHITNCIWILETMNLRMKKSENPTRPLQPLFNFHNSTILNHEFEKYD